MNSEAAQLLRCLQQIHQVISKANEILAGISRPSVCREILLSAPGTAYVLGGPSFNPWQHLLVKTGEPQPASQGCLRQGLSEVYRVSKRLEKGMKVWNLESEALHHGLQKVDLAWNNLLSFLVLGHSVWHTLWDVQLLEPPLGSDSCSPDTNLAPDRTCRVCLTEVKQEPEVLSGNCDLVLHQGSCYHAGCANFWLNCVDSILPRGT